MKKNHVAKRIFACLMVALMMITAAPLTGFVGLELPKWSEMFSTRASAADTYTEGYYTYTVTNAEATITDCDTAISGDVVIPDTLGGYPVVEIGYSAFYDCTGLTSIAIPDSVTSVGREAFYECSGLTSVTIGNSVTTIGEYAFEYCTGLTKINWNAKNVSDFSSGNYIFSEAGTAGDGIDVVFGDNVKRIPAYLFYSRGGSYIKPKIKSVAIGNSVEIIDGSVFRECTSLTNIIIGNSVTSIGDEAFRGCTGLTKINWNAKNVSDFSYDNYIFSEAGTAGDGIDVVFGDNVKRIPAYLFYSRGGSYIKPKIKSVAIGNSVEIIDGSVFRECTSLTNIIIGNSVTSIGGYAFYGCTGLTSITIPDSVTSIGGCAFEGCTGLTSVTIPDSVTSIGNYTFYGCTGLTSITIPDSVITIGNSAFRECTGLTSITIPDSVTSIGNYAFYGCTGLTSITIPDSTTSIGEGAFSRCAGLTKINWNAKNVSDFSSGNYIFSEAGTAGDGIDVVFGDNVKRIPAYLFYSRGGSYIKPKIKSVAIGNSVEIIDGSVFRECTSLTNIIIGNSVTSIGGYAFYGCTGLTKINWNAKNVSDFSSGNYIFSEAGTAGDGIDVVFGDNVKRIPAYLFYSRGDSYIKPKIKSVAIGNGVETIGNYAFRGCTGMTNITIPDSVTSIGNSAFDGTAWYNSQPFGDVYAGKFYYTYKGTMLKNTGITIKDGTKGIAGGAFRDCDGLIDIAIPNSVTNIGDEAFYNCRNLSSVSLGDNVTSIGNSAFAGTSISKIIIPDSVTSIGISAFVGTSISKVIIPDSVTSLGNNAFNGCNLKNITIGSGVETILSGTFQNCPNLTTIKVKKGVKTIEANAFYGIKSIPDIFFEGSEEEWKAISIDQSNDMILRANMYYNADLSHEHSYTETITKPVTCTENGIKTFTCECGKTYTEAIPATGHNFETQTTPATCTSIGVETRICKNCGESHFVKTLPATGHTVSEWIVDSEADCKTTGSKYKECTVCKTVIEKETIPTTSHNFVSNTVEPTCISLGYETRTCENCGECQFVRAIPATGHTKTIVKGEDATCTEKGLTDGVKCSVCGIVIEEQKVIPATGHTEEVIKGKDATCTEKGLTDGAKCSVCGAILIEAKVLPALGHDIVKLSAKEATCLATGLTAGEYCTHCDYKVEQTVIPKKDHTVVVDEAVSATCTETGLTEGKHCSVCGTVLQEQEVIEAKGHSYQNGVCSECGDKAFENCSCICHKGGISAFFYKIARLFWKLFRIKKTCACGAAHY